MIPVVVGSNPISHPKKTMTYRSFAGGPKPKSKHIVSRQNMFQPFTEDRPCWHAGPISRTALANEAGLSERQRKDALRVASIPADEFEQQIESQDVHQEIKSPPHCGERRSGLVPTPAIS